MGFDLKSYCFFAIKRYVFATIWLVNGKQFSSKNKLQMNAEARFATSPVNIVTYIGLTRARGKWQYDIRPELVVKPILE